MKRFIAYFDYLGFKNFIENNDIEKQKQIVFNNFRDMENSISLGKLINNNKGFVADLSTTTINCINFSDTIIFWSNDDSEKSLIELLKVAQSFNWQTIIFCFPTRGAVVYDEIVYIDYRQNNPFGSIYNINSVFGKGIIKAHEKAEKQNWAGTVIDDSLFKELENRYNNIDLFLKPFAKKYFVPYKKNKCTNEEYILNEEYVLSLVQNLKDINSLNNLKERIKENFLQYNKKIDSIDVQKKIDNTIKFLETFYNV